MTEHERNDYGFPVRANTTPECMVKHNITPGVWRLEQVDRDGYWESTYAMDGQMTDHRFIDDPKKYAHIHAADVAGIAGTLTERGYDVDTPT